MEHAESYELPKHHAIDVLSKEIIILEKKMDDVMVVINQMYESPKFSYSLINSGVDELLLFERRIKECKEGLKWIFQHIK